jgi:hypothetical protein
LGSAGRFGGLPGPKKPRKQGDSSGKRAKQHAGDFVKKKM